MGPSRRKIGAVLLALIHDEEKQNQKKRKLWVKPLDADDQDRKKRKVWMKSLTKGDNLSLDIVFKENNPDEYRKHLRITDSAFKELSSLVSPMIKKKDTVMRKSIPAEKRLIATLKFLTTGRALEDLKFSTGISAQALGHIIPQTCQAIYEALQDEYMQFPKTSEDWKKVAEDFHLLWNIPNCGGAVDGKHMPITPPPQNRPQYQNYGGYFSIIITAVVNANLEFMMVDAGRKGGMEEEGNHNINLPEKLMECSSNLPENSETLDGLNFMFVGGEGFAIQEHLMSPFPQDDLSYEEKIYNYRLSRALNIVDNAFGIVASVFKIFQSSVALKPEKITHAVLACCALHNFLLRNCQETYIPENMTDVEDPETGAVSRGTWRENFNEERFVSVKLQGDHLITDEANNARLSYVNYFSGDGKVAWQDSMIN